MEYRDKILLARLEKELKEKEKIFQREKEVVEYLSKIRSLKDRIKEILDIGQELHKNSFPLETTYTYKDNGDCPMGDFFTDGYFHHLGFYSTSVGALSPFPDYLGIKAGGSYGKPDLVVGENGEVAFFHDSVWIEAEDLVCFDATRDLIKRFLEEFDTFDKRVHLYLDHLNDEEFIRLPYKKWNEILESVTLHTNELKEDRKYD